jgi:phosphopantothenoylcysteine synthetase/decarboxylase
MIVMRTPVPRIGARMKVLLGITGSVATIKAPELVAALRTDGHELQVVATPHAWNFTQVNQLGVKAWEDDDEWPSMWQRGDAVPHIDLADWADALVIAPLSANLLADIALGRCDSMLTCIVRAWHRDRPIVIAPAMNTRMWEHPATARHLAQLQADQPRLRVVDPVEKTLACGTYGMGGMADPAAIAAALRSAR